MTKSSKAAARRGKPSYVMSIIGVTLVLFLLGIVGWLVINGNKLGDALRENVLVRAYVKEKVHPSGQDSLDLLNYFAGKPYIKNYEYTNPIEGKEKYLKVGNEDFDTVLGYNPLPSAVFFHVKKEYVNIDSLEKIRLEVKQHPLIGNVLYEAGTVSNLNNNLQRLSVVLLIVAIIIAISVIFLIDNTIRLAMFSNRFLIKTMQMVGATRWFIAKPLSTRAIINGAISAVIAIALVYLMIRAVQNYWPDIAALQDTRMMIMLFVGLLIIGVTITLLSTYRSVLKYLRMKLDELY
jgi:cell division transport system permease protein